MLLIAIVAFAASGGIAAATTASDPPQPVGDPGSWALVFDDEFDGSALDTSRWLAVPWGGNDPSNVSVSGGHLILTAPSATSRAEVSSDPAEGAGANGYVLPVGSFVEARIEFPGNGTAIDNWPAFWASGPGWPDAGENDIAEGLGTLTVNYHSPSGTHNEGTVSGIWSNAFHTYGLYRGSHYSEVFWDGTMVKKYSTDDDGLPESIIISTGGPAQGPAVWGTGSQVKVDYVRAWQPL